MTWWSRGGLGGSAEDLVVPRMLHREVAFPVWCRYAASRSVKQ